MTLQNGLLTREAAYLWTETALYSMERELLYHEPKHFVGQGWPYAIVHSGTTDAWEAVYAEIEAKRPQGLDALVRLIAPILEPFLVPVWGFNQRVLIASYEGQPRLTVVSTEPLGGYAPLQAIPIRTHMVNSTSDRIAREVARGVSVETMPRIIRAQHADSLLEGNWPLAGKVTRVKVSRAGVEVEDVDELPDLLAA
jgi:hypothetical protein